jgi:hypothetical protein
VPKIVDVNMVVVVDVEVKVNGLSADVGEVSGNG